MDIDSLHQLLSGYRFRFVSERDLQDGIERALIAAGISYEREAALSDPDRPDFLVGDGIAVEVKIKGSLSELIRQAARYASHQRIGSILVVGTPRWLPRVPDALSGKPVRSLRLVGSLL